MITRTGCIFCCIDDTSDGPIVAESANVFVRRDNLPATRGHLHIVPKRHIVSFSNLSPPERQEIMEMISTMQERLDGQYSPDGYNIGFNEGPASGASFEHLHVHVIPRYIGDCPDPRWGIRRGLPNGDPDQWITSGAIA